MCRLRRHNADGLRFSGGVLSLEFRADARPTERRTGVDTDGVGSKDVYTTWRKKNRRGYFWSELASIEIYIYMDTRQRQPVVTGRLKRFEGHCLFFVCVRSLDGRSVNRDERMDGRTDDGRRVGFDDSARRVTARGSAGRVPRRAVLYRSCSGGSTRRRRQRRRWWR